MKRLRKTLTVVEFAVRAIWYIWWEPKTTVAWQREEKRVNFSVTFYNHLSDDEIER